MKQLARNRDTDHPQSLFALAVLYITLNLGTFIRIGSINTSWVAAAFVIYTYIREDGKLTYTSGNVKNVFVSFVLWLLYAAFQLIYVKEITYYTTFMPILIANIFIVLFSLLIIRTPYELRYALNAFMIALTLNFIAAGWELYTGRLIIPNAKYRGLAVVCGFIGNFNDFCTFMFIAIIMFSIMFFVTRKFAIKFLYISGIVCAILIIFYNGARGAIYAVYVYFALWTVFFILGKFVKSAKMYNALVVCFAIVIVITLAVYVNDVGIDYALSLLDRSGGGDTRSDIWRYNAIVQCLTALLNSFGFGVGAGQTNAILGTNVHNFYVEIFAEFGVLVGLFAVYMSLIVFLKRNNSLPLIMDTALQAGGCAMIMANVTSSSSNKMRALWIMIVLVYLIKKTDLLVVQLDKGGVE